MKFYHTKTNSTAGAAAREREAQAEPRHTTKGLITPLRTPVCFRLRRFIVPVFAFVIFIFAATGTAVGVIEKGPVASAMARPAFLAASGVEPSREEISSGTVTALWMLGGFIMVLEIVKFFRSDPPNHKQFADRADTKEQLENVIKAMKELSGEFRSYQSEQAGRRRMLYSRVARTENALCFLQGKIGHDGDEISAAKLGAILNTRVEAAHDE